MSDVLIFFHEMNLLKYHWDEVVGLDQEGLLVAVKDKSSEFEVRLSPVDAEELVSIKFNHVFSLTTLVIGILLSALGAGWLVGFFMGVIPVLFWVIALGMIVVGGFMATTCVQTRCEFETKEGIKLSAIGVALKRNEIANWAYEHGISI